VELELFAASTSRLISTKGYAEIIAQDWSVYWRILFVETTKRKVIRGNESDEEATGEKLVAKLSGNY